MSEGAPAPTETVASPTTSITASSTPTTVRSVAVKRPGGIVTTDGRVGDLTFDVSTEANVEASVGMPEVRSMGKMAGGVAEPAYEALGYGCSGRPERLRALQPAPPPIDTCETVYYINAATKRLDAFGTLTSEFTTATGVRVGMTRAEVGRREQVHTSQCLGFDDVYLGGWYLYGARTGAVVVITFHRDLSRTNASDPTTLDDPVDWIGAESNAHPVGAVSC